MEALVQLVQQLLLWFGLPRMRERALAAGARDTEVGRLEARLRRDALLLEASSRGVAGEPHLVLGRAGTIPYRLALRGLRGAHSHLVAQPGAGKSRLLTSIIRQLLELMWFGGASYSVILVDPKNETVDLVARVVGELLARMPVQSAERRAQQVITIRPFVGGYLTPLGMLVRDTSVDLFAQARTILELLWRAANAAVGIRQGVAGEFALAALVANGVSLVEAPFLMRDPRVMRGLAERVPEPRLHAYFRSGDYAKEARVTIQGLIARIEAVVGIASLGAMLAGPESLDLRQAYAPGTLVLVGLDGGPLGSSALAPRGHAARPLEREGDPRIHPPPTRVPATHRGQTRRGNRRPRATGGQDRRMNLSLGTKKPLG